MGIFTLLDKVIVSHCREFDEGLLPRISDVFYEDELVNFPSAPDVGNYLISEVITRGLTNC